MYIEEISGSCIVFKISGQAMNNGKLFNINFPQCARPLKSVCSRFLQAKILCRYFHHRLLSSPCQHIAENLISPFFLATVCQKGFNFAIHVAKQVLFLPCLTSLLVIASFFDSKTSEDFLLLIRWNLTFTSHLSSSCLVAHRVLSDETWLSSILPEANSEHKIASLVSKWKLNLCMSWLATMV